MVHSSNDVALVSVGSGLVRRMRLPSSLTVTTVLPASAAATTFSSSDSALRRLNRSMTSSGTKPSASLDTCSLRNLSDGRLWALK